MRTKQIFTVIWSSNRDTDEVTRFSKLEDAIGFSVGKRHYQEPAEPICEDVPIHIAKRWGF